MTLQSLVFEGSHPLMEQSYAPRDMRGGGRINADGFGLGWTDPETSTVARYRRATPIWSDTSLASLAAVTRSGAVLAALRNASAGMPVVETACAPFTDGRWLFSHNGLVVGWPTSVAQLAETLPTAELLRLEAPNDSALLWALLRDRLATAPAAEALRSLALDVLAVAPESRLNLMLVGEDQLVATTVVHSLSYRVAADDARRGVIVSSEPIDDADDWVAVDDRSLLVATADGVRISPLHKENPDA